MGIKDDDGDDGDHDYDDGGDEYNNEYYDAL